MKFLDKERLFWSETLTVVGSALPLVMPRALLFGLFALAVTAVDRNSKLPDLAVDITPFEVAGGILSLLLVLRTNAGYERWWEARKIWGDIVNRSRNLAIAALSHGPDDRDWRDRIVRRTVAFCHATRQSLRGERAPADLERVLGRDEAERVVSAQHMPSAAALLIGRSLRDARDGLGLDGFALLRIDPERAALVDDIGGCERIMKTPLPMAYRIEIRRFLILFIAAIPFAVVHRIEWLTPLVTVLIAIPLLAVDKIGTELQQPFSKDSLNHLPLDDICATIEGNLLHLLDERSAPPVAKLTARDGEGSRSSKSREG